MNRYHVTLAWRTMHGTLAHWGGVIVATSERMATRMAEHEIKTDKRRRLSSFTHGVAIMLPEEA